MTREDIQKEALETAVASDNMLLEWCTGLGKSRAAIRIAEQWLGKGFGEVMLFVGEEAHKRNWEREIAKWGEGMEHIAIECYASIRKYEGRRFDVLILDEVHHAGTEIRKGYLEKIGFSHLVALSATVDPEMRNYLVSLCEGRLAVSRFPLSRAIEEGIMPQPSVYAVPLSLHEDGSMVKVTATRGLKRYRRKESCRYKDRYKYLKDTVRYAHLELEMLCTMEEANEWYDQETAHRQTMFFRSRTEYDKNKWLLAGSERKRFLGSAKTPYARRVLDAMGDRKLVCFCSSISQVEDLGGSHAIHSRRKDNASTIASFNEGRTRRLFAVGMATEGMNLDGIEAGLIVQLDNSERQFIQKMGRTMRAEKPVQVLLYWEGTRDEDFLGKAMEQLGEGYVRKVSMEELERILKKKH